MVGAIRKGAVIPGCPEPWCGPTAQPDVVSGWWLRLPMSAVSVGLSYFGGQGHYLLYCHLPCDVEYHACTW